MDCWPGLRFSYRRRRANFAISAREERTHRAIVPYSTCVCVAIKLCYPNMCEKRTRKFKRGSNVTRLREARRLQRLQWLATPIVQEETTPAIATQTTPEKVAQNRLILDLAWKTLALMHKNRLIQEKIVALQKETSEFVSAIMSNPENKRRYLEYVRLYNAGQLPDLKKELESKLRLKTEPE